MSARKTVKPLVETPVVVEPVVVEPVVVEPVVVEPVVVEPVVVEPVVVEQRMSYHEIASYQHDLPFKRYFLNGDHVVLVPLDYHSTGMAGFYTSGTHEAVELANFAQAVFEETGYLLKNVVPGEMSQNRFALFSK
jgi:hypothetical protein